MSARAIAIHGNEMSGERRANLEIKSECPALHPTLSTILLLPKILVTADFSGLIVTVTVTYFVCHGNS